MLRFALNASRQMDAATSEALVELWCDLFKDLSHEVLETAFRRTLAACRFFPSVADVRSHVDRADAQGLALEAETAWQELLDWLRLHFGDRRAPRLPERIERAARAAGGLRFLERCAESELVWAKKRFVEAFERDAELQSAGQLVGRSEARRILSEARMAAEADRPALPEARKPHDDGGDLGLAGLRDSFADAVRALPPAEPKEKPAAFTGFRFPVDPNHEERVRRQAAEILAGVRA